MNLDRATITLVPRTTASCIDLAVRFIGRHLSMILWLWLLVAAPAAVTVYIFDQRLDLGLLSAALAVLFFSLPLEVALCLGAIPATFGDPFCWKSLWQRIKSDGLRLLAKGLLLRIGIGLGMMLCVLPGLWIAARTSFFIERACLKENGKHLHDQQTDALLARQSGNLFGRACWLCIVCALLWITLFITCDVGLRLLLGIGILTGHTSGLDEEALVDSLLHSPRVLAAASAVALFVFIIARLAWFFCYVDARVRYDCWDMQLEFERQARSLTEAA